MMIYGEMKRNTSNSPWKIKNDEKTRTYSVILLCELYDDDSTNRILWLIILHSDEASIFLIDNIIIVQTSTQFFNSETTRRKLPKESSQ